MGHRIAYDPIGTGAVGDLLYRGDGRAAIDNTPYRPGGQDDGLVLASDAAPGNPPYKKEANGSYDYDPKVDPTFNQQLEDRAKLADIAYDKSVAQARAETPAGWTLEGPGSYFNRETGEAASAYLFRNNNTGQYVLAFPGTKITNLADSATNFAQGAGLESPEYSGAMKLAASVFNDLKGQKHVGRDDLEVVGHSLGGGLATAAAVANGLKATVFNPAGVHDNTMAAAVQPHFDSQGNVSPTAEQKDQYKQEMQKRISAFAVKYEALTSLQDKPGVAGLVMPHTFGTVYNMSTGGWYESAVDRLKIGDTRVLALPVVRALGLSTIGIDRQRMSSIRAALGDTP